MYSKALGTQTQEQKLPAACGACMPTGTAVFRGRPWLQEEEQTPNGVTSETQRTNRVQGKGIVAAAAVDTDLALYPLQQLREYLKVSPHGCTYMWPGCICFLHVPAELRVVSCNDQCDCKAPHPLQFVALRSK